MRKFLVISVLVGMMALGWWVARRTDLAGLLRPTANRQKSIPRTAKVERRDIRVTVEAIGEINPSNQVAVKSEVNGRIATIHVGTGQEVKQGAPLVSLDDTDLLTEKSTVEAEVDGAKFRWEKAERDYGRLQDLFRDHLVSREAFDDAKTERDLAHNEAIRAARRLQLVEDKLKKVRILAPFDGTILSVSVTPGQVVSGATGVNQGTDLMMLANLNEMVIRSHVNQVDVAKLRPQQEAVITVDSIPNETLKGRVVLIAPVATVKNNVKGFHVDVVITQSDPRIRPGMNANLEFPVLSVDGALSVPISAVFVEGGKMVVYVQTSHGIKRREVKLGATDYRHTQVLEGVTEGDIVLLERSSGQTAM